MKSETVLPLFEEAERSIAAQKGLLTSFGAHRRNVERVVDTHTYESDSKVWSGEGSFFYNFILLVASIGVGYSTSNARFGATQFGSNLGKSTLAGKLYLFFFS